jgi:23S rRNA (uracil1939-C5)-methyltransferase
MSALSAPATEDDPSAGRVFCEHAERCGGCPVIGLGYAEQLRQKGARVVEAAARYPGLVLVRTEPILPADPIVGYRTRAKLIVSPGPRVGLFARGGGHEVVDIPGCRVLAGAIASVAATLRTQIAADEENQGPLAPFSPSGRGSLRAVDLREVRDDGAGRVLVTFVMEGARVAETRALEQAADELMRAAPEVIGVAANFHDGDGPQILGNRTVTLAGASNARDRVGQSVHLATFGSFVQAHRGQASRVHALVANAIGLFPEPLPGGKGRVLDLYGGSGSIALSLAAAGARVHMIESFAPAVAQARQAARAQGLDVHAECADVAESLQGLWQKRERFDAAVLNPPRRGTSPATREWLARLEPRVIVYVACDPETLTRDLDHFARLGYATASLHPVDMIPLSEEVETVAVLLRSEVPAARVVYESDELLIVEKGPHEPTTPQGEYAGSLLARVRRIAGAQAAVPVHRLDVGTGGLVMFARTAKHVAAWARVLAAPSTCKNYIAAVRGVIPMKGTIARSLRENGKTYQARTRYRRLAIISGHSVVRALPDQGRTHQLRRHLAAIGHPVLGDERYGDPATNRYFAEKHGLDRAFLHCLRLEFDHPRTLARQVAEAPVGGDLRAVLDRIGGAGTLRFLDQKNALGSRLD